MFIGYIYVLNNDGYVMQTKYRREIMALPIVGEPVKSFYNEIFPFVNFSAQFNDANEVLLIENDNLLAFTQEEILQKSISLAKEFLSLVKLSGCVDLLQSSDKDWPSLYDETVKALMYLDKSINTTNETEHKEFSQAEYQRLHNQLQVCSAGTKEVLFFNKMLSGINTVLMLNNLIPQSRIIHLSTYRDENDEEKLDYGKAASVLRNLAYVANNIPKRKF